ncbi:hypothetical protein ACS15_4720 [Ralstonia insidiosa]|uniref:Uncharacterized protein n=1 Tax=Ralstonia insidiosa TaxID=190721 RepID=A0AAC9FU53_9RALS|nr:hypothetical protein ACS15_4720 [Ralstonia insidiosa]
MRTEVAGFVFAKPCMSPVCPTTIAQNTWYVSSINAALTLRWTFNSGQNS